MRVLLSVGLLAAFVLAGCSSGGGGETPGNQDKLDVDAATGGIRGVVVDQAISPVAGALVTISGGASTESGPDGAFNFTRLEAGEYLVSVGKPGFKGAQTTTTVVAGDAEPAIVKLLLERLSTATPYLDHFKLDGYYDCAFSYGNPGQPIITDACDFGYRTAWDGVNETGNEPPAPRTIQRSVNTQFIDIPDDTYAAVQEAFWDSESVPVMMVLLSSTPIRNDCDCSDKDYIDVTMPSPTYGRLERYDANGTEIKGFPLGEKVASRGFLSWEATSTAQNFPFVVMTTLFHNYVPDPEWTFLTKENYPVG